MECATYAAFGVPIAMLGAGWPGARQMFDRPSSALGLLAMAYGIGRLATAATGQLLLRRWRIGGCNRAALAIMATAEVAVALTTSFPLLVGAFTVVGLCSGSLDSLGNRYQTEVRLVRNAGLMFGAYGIGATIGPALIALTTWTTAYLAAAAVSASAAVLAGSNLVAWPAGLTTMDRSHAHVDPDTGIRTTAKPAPLALVPLVTTLFCFALYCALEVSTGGWTASYFEEYRGTSAQWAGLAVSGFWAGITLSRLLMGRLRLDPHRILSVGAPAVVVAYVSVPFLPTPLAIAAVLVGGAALSVMLPTLIVTTTERVGAAATGRVTGYQLLAANVGATAITAGIGVIVARTYDGAPIWVLIGLAVVALPLLLRTLHLHPPDPATGSEGEVARADRENLATGKPA